MSTSDSGERVLCDAWMEGAHDSWFGCDRD